MEVQTVRRSGAIYMYALHLAKSSRLDFGVRARMHDHGRSIRDPIRRAIERDLIRLSRPQGRFWVELIKIASLIR